MNASGAMQIFDGSMLSDAGLHINGRGVQFNMALSGFEHIDWLNIISDAVASLGIIPCIGYPKLVKWRRSRSQAEYGVCRLITRNSVFLIGELSRWYPSNEGLRPGAKLGGKRVPLGFKLTRVSLAHWFMGDGNSYKYARRKNDKTTSVRFATHRFNHEDIEGLQIELEKLGLKSTTYPYKNVRSGSGLEIFLLQESVDKFMSLVEPFIAPSYRYKLKARELEVR